MSNKNLNNLYNSKYLKYKNKYIQLKKQLGSGFNTWDDLKNISNTEVTTYKTDLNKGVLNNNCPNSNYTFTGFSSDFYKKKCNIHKKICNQYGFEDVQNNGADCLKCLKSKEFLQNEQITESGEIVEISNYSTRYNENLEMNEVCNEISEVTGYFKTNNIFNYVINLESRKDNLSDSIILNDILLSTDRYSSEPFTIKLQEDKDLICSEGNIKYIDSSCNVGSGGITSCLFVILELEDKKSIIFHLNGLLDNNFGTSNYIDQVIKYKFTPSNCFKYIKENFKDNIKTLTKIYLVGVLKNYTIDDAKDGFIYGSEEQLSENNLDSLTEDIIVTTIKKKLDILSGKKISLVKNDCGTRGNFIYKNNNLFYLQ